MSDPVADRAAWVKRNIRQLVAAGATLDDAMIVTQRILKRTPPGALLDTLPTDDELRAMAIITDADVADARADWFLHAPQEWKPLLDAIEETRVTEGSDSSGNWGHAGVEGQLGGSASGGGFGSLGIEDGAADSEKQAMADAQRVAVGRIEQVEGAASKAASLYQAAYDLENNADAWPPMPDPHDREAFAKYKEQTEPLSRRIDELLDAHAQAEQELVDMLKHDDLASDQNLVCAASIKRDEELYGGLTTARAIVGAGVIDEHAVSIKAGTGRAGCELKAGKSLINIDQKQYTGRTLAHEYGHAVEQGSPFVRKACQDFLSRRTEGEQAISLKEATGNAAYGVEQTKPDKFFSAYCGKTYATGDTEIFSMGLERLVSDPGEFQREDPDYFGFMIRTIEGAKVSR